ncbi:MAG TPA: murein biosynthesis integral membrane protein MurJ [Verrucomicrobiae bacterium]|nr:murein biosynthesis integral membrane protein MurJ [Verrucomicrobiae bacterium]
MLKSTGAMGLATLTSRILGMVREMVYAGFMGDRVEASAFKTALMIPNLFRRLLGEGALTAAFIPIFKEKERNEGEAEMWKAANGVISGLILSASVVVLLAMIGMTVALIATAPSGAGVTSAAGFQPEVYLPGIGKISASSRLMLELARVMFPYMLLACLAAILMGMLNARGHFFVPALGACIMNLVLIASVYFLAPLFGKKLETRIFALAYGVLVAGVAQAAYQVPALLKEGFRFYWVTPFGNPVVKRVVRQMVPGMLGISAFQFNVLTTAAIAWWVDDTIYASYDYAVRLMEFPQGLFGISLATYLLPTLSGLAVEKKFGEFRATYKQAVGYLFFSNLLASILLVVLAQPMIRLLFEHGKFDHFSTIRSSYALACLGPGLLAFSMVNITARAYYALGDTQTPMKISAFCLLLNVVFALFTVPALRQGGMGIANTLSAGVNVYLLIYGLKRKLSKLEFSDLRPIFFQMISAGVLAALLAYGTSVAWEHYIGGAHLLSRIGAVFVPVGVATGAYLATLVWLRVPQAQDVVQVMRAKIRR